MWIDLLLFAGVIVLVGAATMGFFYFIYRRGIAIRFNAVVVGTTGAAATGGFVLGSMGISIQTLLLAGVIVLPAYLLVFWLLRWLVNPLKQLAETAKQVSLGETGIVIPAGRNDEIGEVQDAFRNVSEYFSTVAGVTAQVAQGDLTSTIAPRGDADVLGKAMQSMIVDLRALVQEMTKYADGVSQGSANIQSVMTTTAGAAQQIAASMNIVTGRSNEQTRKVLEVRSAAEQLVETIDTVVNGAQSQAEAVTNASMMMDELSKAADQVRGASESQAEQISASAASQAAMMAALNGVLTSTGQLSTVQQETVQAARLGSQMVEKSTSSMKHVLHATQDLAGRVQDLGQRSAQIGVVIETIDDIAAQTNLLALNAAIEAARAGEHGKGFAVVADEVRKLAERSALATREIAEMIKAVQAGARQVSEAMQQTGDDVRAAAQSTDDAGQTFQQIHGGTLKAVERLTTVQSEIEVMQTTATQLTRTFELAGETLTQNLEAAQHINALVQKVVSNTDRISEVVEENLVATEQMAASANQTLGIMDGLAESSQETISETEQVNEALQHVSAQFEQANGSVAGLSEVAMNLQQRTLRFKTVKVSGKTSRGNALLGRIDFVKEKYGISAWNRVLAALPPEARQVLGGTINPAGEYAPELLGQLTDAIRNTLAGGSQEILRAMTAFRARLDLVPGAPLAHLFDPKDPGAMIRKMDLCLRHNWGEGVITLIEPKGHNHVNMRVDMGRKQPRERCTYNHPGWMDGVIEAAGGTPHIVKTACMHDGAPYCEYDVRWETGNLRQVKQAALADNTGNGKR